jgi:hypothetical protein
LIERTHESPKIKKHSNTEPIVLLSDSIRQDLSDNNPTISSHQKIIKKLVSKRKLLHCIPPSNTYDESPAKLIDKRNIKLRL